MTALLHKLVRNACARAEDLIFIRILQTLVMSVRPAAESFQFAARKRAAKRSKFNSSTIYRPQIVAAPRV